MVRTVFICHSYKNESFASMSFHLANDLVTKGYRVIFISKDPYFEKPQYKKLGKGELILYSWPSQVKSSGLKDFLWFYKLWEVYRPIASIGHHNGSIVSNILLTIMGLGRIKTFDYHHINSQALIEARGELTLRLRFFFWRKRVFYHFFCSKVICPSYEAIRNLEEFFNYKRGVVIPNPLPDNSHPTQPSSTSNKVVFGYLGRLDRNKNPLSLIDAFEHLADRFMEKKLSLIIAGDGELKDEVKKRVEKNPRIHWLGFLNYQEIDSFYKKIDWLVVPSISDVLPTVGIEAMVHSKPLILSHGCGLKDFLVEGQSFILSKHDSNSLYNALFQSVIKTEDEYVLMSKNSRLAYEDKFRLENYFSKIEGLIM